MTTLERTGRAQRPNTRGVLRTVVRWTVAVVVVVHGAIHLLGPVRAFDLARVDALTQPISRPVAVLWGVAAALVVAAGLALVRRSPSWPRLALAAAVVSQAVIVTSWADARAGTLANVLLLAAAAYGYASPATREVQGGPDAVPAGDVDRRAQWRGSQLP